MKSNYRKIGDFIQLVDERNTDLNINLLLGLSINKVFIPSVANIVGTNMANYKIIRKNQFSCSLMQVRRDKKIPVALLKDYDEAIISQAYPVFKISDTDELLPDYLMMWMSRSEFDREACFNAVGGVRGSLEWEDFCNMELPVPSPEKQQEIVDEYNTVVNRIKLNEELNRKLDETAQTLYKHWFVDFEFPISKDYANAIGNSELEGLPYKSSGGEMVFDEDLSQEIPKGWSVQPLGDLINYKKGFPIKSEWYSSKGSKIVRVSNLTDKSIDISGCNYIDDRIAKDLSDFSLRTNDVIIATVGSWPQNPASSVGNVIKVPELASGSILNQNAVRIRPNDGISKYLLYVSIKHRKFSEYVISGAQGSANQASVTLKHTFAFPVVLPDNENHDRFAEIYIPLFQLLNKLETEISFLKKLSEILLSSLIKTDKLYDEVY